jgi:orotate phosphoribosyltransferase
VADASTRDHRVLLLDDVYTTGARAQSAAFALRAAGAVVPAVLVIGRRVNPEWRDEVDVIWQRQTAIPFRFEDPPWWRA